MEKGSNFTIGLGRYYSLEKYLDAARDAVKNFQKYQETFIYSNFCELVIVIIKIGTLDNQLNRANEIVDFISNELQLDTNLYVSQMEDAKLRDKIEVTLLGI